MSEDFELPKRMFRQGRGVDTEFETIEKLYQRYSELLPLEGKLYPNAIRFPDFSVNRSKYSEPRDVLLHNYPELLNMGVLSFKVGDIPDPITTGKGTELETTYSFRVTHLPEDENYSHSEVQTLKDQNYSKNMTINSKLVKKKFRIQIAKCLEIEKQPN